MGVKKVINGNLAAAIGAKLSRPSVIAAYPITPQTTIVEKLAEFVSNGDLKAEYIRVESEHSAMSACIGAEACGVRTYTATSSQGLALMHEMLHVAGGARLPIGMGVVNRTLSVPLNIFVEYNDVMPERDSGWIILFAENPQEVLDTTIQLYKVGEDRDVLLPAMTCMDSFILSHTYEPVDIPSQREVDNFLPPLQLDYVLDVEKPIAIAPLMDHRLTPEYRYLQEVAMRNSREVIRKVNEEFYEAFGRSYGNGLIEKYHMDGAEVALLATGSNVGTVKVAVNMLRKDGENIGLIKLRSFRPFPSQDLKEALKGVEVLGVLDRSASFGSGGPIYLDVRSSLYNPKGGLNIINFIAGLGGRDVKVGDVAMMYKKLQEVKKVGYAEEEVVWLDVRR